MRNTLFILLVSLSMVACGGGDDMSLGEQPPISTVQIKADVTIVTQAQISASPYTRLINNASISIKSTAYLNQMPRVVNSPGEAALCKTPTLIVPIELSSVPAVSLTDVTVEAVFVAADGKWWESPVNAANTVEQIGKKIVVASGCPLAPFLANEKIQVIVKITQGGQTGYIRAPEQPLASVQ